MKIRVAVLDMAGTTVADEVRGSPFVLEAYAQVFRREDIAVDAGALNEYRGLDKREVIRAVLEERKKLSGAALEGEADRLLDNFRARCLALVDEVRAVEGAKEAIRWLKGRGIPVALASGLPQEIAETMARATGLAGGGLADYVTSAERAGGGRPGPEMINDALIRFGLLGGEAGRDRPSPDFDYAQVLKVGDTPADVREGLAVGAVTLAVSSGTHPAERLRGEGAFEVLSSVEEIPAFLGPRLEG